MKNILVLLADIANGIFAVIIAASITQTEIIWWYFLIGLLLAMCPDLDALPEICKRGKVSASSNHISDHREVLHFPSLFLITGIILIVWFGFWGWVFFLATMLHFVNDFYGTGWGIPLFWPVTRRRYKFLGRRANRLKSILQENGDWDTISESERKLRFLVSWKEEELSAYIKRWGIDDWIDIYYLRLNWISFIEYLLFAFASILLLLQIFK